MDMCKPLTCIAWMRQAYVPSLCVNNTSERSVVLLVNVKVHIIGDDKPGGEKQKIPTC